MFFLFFALSFVSLTKYPVKQLPTCFHYDLEYNFYSECKEEAKKQGCWNKFAELVDKMAFAHHRRQYCFSIDSNVFMDTKTVTVNNVEYNFMEYVLGKCDRVTLMDYNKDVTKVLDQAEAEIAYYDKVGKKLDIGILVTCPESVESFCGKSNTELENALTEIHDHFKSHSSFGMAAIHYLKNWYERNPSTTSSSVNRAVWSWDWGESILTDDDPAEATQRKEILDFMAKNKVKKIYVAAETALYWSSRRIPFAKFLNDTYDLGIEVELEIGDSVSVSKNKTWLYNHDVAVYFANRMMDTMDEYYDISVTKKKDTEGDSSGLESFSYCKMFFWGLWCLWWMLFVV